MTKQDYLRLMHEHLLARLYAFPGVQSVYTKTDADGMHFLAIVSASDPDRLSDMAVAATLFKFIEWMSKGLEALKATSESLPPIKSQETFITGEVPSGPKAALLSEGWQLVARSR